MNKHPLSAFGLALIDWSMTVLAWIVFFSLRKRIEGRPSSWNDICQDDRLWQGLLLIPLCWIFLFTIIGIYKEVLKASRLSVIYSTFVSVSFGSLLLLFGVLSDDLTLDFRSYFFSFLSVLIIHFSLITPARLGYLSMLKWLIQRKVIPWNIAWIGKEDPTDVPRYINITKRMQIQDFSFLKDEDYKVFDEVWIADISLDELEKYLPILIGKSRGLGIMIHETKWRQLEYRYSATPKLKIPYVSIAVCPISWWQRHVKRVGDLIVSVIALCFLSPLILILAYKVNRSSQGGVFYLQERIGRWGATFEIIKFRTMIEEAEESGPSLASIGDPRCTPIGAWMRKWRLDEVPQFINVLKGDMSLVGPRPERMFYTEKLMKLNHLYPTLWQVRPGITSWGQIKYGYASTIDQMLQRFRFDLLYIEHMGLVLDIRILYYTLLVLLQGKGR